MNNFNSKWNNQETALLWPKGSVVLMRIKDSSPMVHEYRYIISSYLIPESIAGEFFSEW